MIIRSWAEAPRWAGLKDFLYEAACETGIRYTTLEESKGLLRTRIYFEIDGSQEAIDQFERIIQEVAKAHNA